MPVGPFPTFDACVRAQMKKGYGKDAARRICGKIENQSDTEMTKDERLKRLFGLIEETLDAKGASDEEKSERQLDLEQYIAERVSTELSNQPVNTPEPIRAEDVEGEDDVIVAFNELESFAGHPSDPAVVPTEMRLFATGKNRMRKGGRTFTIVFDSESEQMVREAHNNQGRDQLPVDYDHGMLGMITTPEGSAAAGWFTLSFRADGVYASDIEWTNRAKRMLEEREYRYSSPAVRLEETNEVGVMRVVEVINVAITNLPATVGQKPLVANATQENEDMNLKELLELLGAKDDAEAKAKIEALLSAEERAQKAEQKAEEAKTVAKGALEQSEKLSAEKSELLGAAGATDLDGLRERMSKLEAQAQSAEQLSTRVTELEQERAKERHAAVKQALVDEGKLTPAQFSWADTQSADQLQTWGENAPVVLSGERKAPADPKQLNGGELTEEERQVISLVGGVGAKEFSAAKSSNEETHPWKLSAVEARNQPVDSTYLTPYRTGG